MSAPADSYPGPLLYVAIDCGVGGDKAALSRSMDEAVADDPSSSVGIDRETGLMILASDSEAQLREVLDRLTQRATLALDISPPRVVYRETVAGSAESEATVVRMEDGIPQYAHVVLAVAPAAAQTHLEFVEGRTVDERRFPSAVERGVKEAMAAGVLAGYAMTGIRVAVVGSSHHETDSSEAAFRAAGASAFSLAAKRASPILVEPLMSVEVTVPDECLGDAIGDLSSRGGLIVGTSPRDGGQVITAKARLAEMLDHTGSLQTLAARYASITIEFERFIEVRPNVGPDGKEPMSAALRAA